MGDSFRSVASAGAASASGRYTRSRVPSPGRVSTRIAPHQRPNLLPLQEGPLVLREVGHVAPQGPVRGQHRLPAAEARAERDVLELGVVDLRRDLRRHPFVTEGGEQGVVGVRSLLNDTALPRVLRSVHADALVAFRGEMGDAWRDTTVVVMTEFGRTARPNGTRDTDHGTAGAGFVIGPRVARSSVIADWPGLGERALYESRDVAPTLDTRAVLKGAIAATFDLDAGQADRVFPDSAGVRGLYDIMG